MIESTIAETPNGYKDTSWSAPTARPRGDSDAEVVCLPDKEDEELIGGSSSIIQYDMHIASEPTEPVNPTPSPEIHRERRE